MILWLVAAALTVNLTCLLIARALWIAAAWGVLWGIALGWWLLAGPLLESQSIGVHGLSDRLWLTALLTVTFAFLGAAIAFTFGGVLTGGLRHATPDARRRRFALLSPAVLVPGYLVASAMMEFLLLGNVNPPAGNITQVISATLGVLLAVFVLSRLAKKERLRHWFASSRVAAAAGVIAVTGMVYVRVPAPRMPASTMHPATEAVESPLRRAPGAPLLFVGIDSGNWATLRPGIAEGRLPLFKQIYETGSSGTIQAPWPPYWSAPAWAAILTGFGREHTRVYEDIVLTVPGLVPFEIGLRTDLRLNPIRLMQHLLTAAGAIAVAPHHRNALAKRPIWEELARHQVKTAVIRFPFTHPAGGPAAYVVSNRLDAEGWQTLWVKAAAPSDAVFPSEFADDIRPLLNDGLAVEELLRSIAPGLDGPNPRDALTELRPIIQSVMTADRRSFAAAQEALQRDRGIEALMLYIGGFDVICHAFWQYRFPDEFARNRPDPQDVKRFGSAIDRYLEYIDRELRKVVSAFPTSPNVVIVSDHGHEGIDKSTVWRGAHGAQGIFMTAGPDVRTGAPIQASYLDVFPTVLALLRLPASTQRAGRAHIGTPDGQ